MAIDTRDRAPIPIDIPERPTFGSAEDLQRFESIEPVLENWSQLQEFLRDIEYTESVAAAIRRVSGINGYVELGGPETSHLTAQIVDLGYPDTFDNRIFIEGERQNGGLFDYQYRLVMPIEKVWSDDQTEGPLDTTKPLTARTKRADDEWVVYEMAADAPKAWSLMKMAAAELRVLVERDERLWEVAKEIGERAGKLAAGSATADIKRALRG